MENKSKFSNFTLRLLSSIILLPVVIWVTLGGGFLFLILLLIVAYLSSREWTNICGRWSLGFDGMGLITFVCLALTASYLQHLVLAIIFLVIGIYVSYLGAKVRAKFEHRQELEPSYLNRPLFFAIGMAYIGITFVAIAYVGSSFSPMRMYDPMNITTLWVFGIVVCSDVSAYIFGSLIKGKKLAPSISPGKTWSGFISAIIVTFIVSYLVASTLNLKNVLDLAIYGATMVIVAHVGDLLESGIKRYLKIKDSGSIIPGHGGILDRIDALSLVAIVTFIIILLTQKSILFI